MRRFTVIGRGKCQVQLRVWRFVVHGPLLQQTKPAITRNLKHRGDKSIEEGGLAGMLAPPSLIGGFGTFSNGHAVLLDQGPGLAQ